ncbi:hypothetical protein FOC1_g10000814 [Fusarium oxysporum f. sp. cubense race 1]|uniref:Uncharacterized protein n=1 Tax=Fusarium oxysporum f. sp. cubense (strain race 1) TaxID=1229664 RepID=N4UHR0_FUSC1|nr:hypothetical protein FOC1_g10000814 [Fusarium oxysporum f. sp. cubense race 1]
MGGGPDKSEVPSRVDPSGASEDAPDEEQHNSRPMTDSVSHDTSEVLAVTELDGASSQSPRPDKGDAVDIESHENTKVNDSDDDTATIKQPETRPITHDQLVAEVKGIYAGLGMVEKKCIEVDDGQMPWTDGPPDIPSYLLTIPEAMLILLKMGEEARKKVIDGKYYLNIGYDLVDQLLRDLETVKSRAKEPALGLLAIWPFIHAGCHRLWNMVRALLVFLCFRLCGLTKSESEKTPAIELPIYVEIRPLSDQSRYKKVGTEYWVLVSGRWIRSLRGEQMAVEERDINARERWRNTAREEYTQARNDDPTVGRHYHHLAILVQPRSSSPDTSFDADVSRFLYYTNSLVVKTPFYAARKSVLTVIKTIVGRNKEAAEKPVSFPQTDQDHFLTAVAHLILASLEPETRKANGYEGSRNNHLQTVYTALEKIKVGGPAKTSRLCPSAQLGLLLCQLLLGIPLADNRWSPMMAKFAPDLVTDEDRSDSDAMANARDIHDATIELINTMVPYLLEGADTRALGVWRFILVILMFMRSLKTRPALREWWFGSAFHAEALTPYFNLILRQDEIQGAAALASASQSELITKPTKDAVQTAEVPAVEQAQETTLTDAKTDSEARDGVLTNSASENEAEYDILTNSVAGEAQKEQQAKIEAVEAPSADVEMKESENKNARQQDSDTQTKEEDAEKTQLEDEQKRGEAEEARLAQEAGEEEIRRQEGLRRDPPLFPNGWLKQSKYSFDEIQVFDYVESLEMCNDRFVQILRLATQLIGDFFDLKTDEERRPWFSVPGVSSVPKLEPSKMMPDIIERDSGFRVVFVDPSFHAVELKEEEERLARTEEMRKEKERQNEEKSAEAAPGAAAVVDEKTEGNAEEAHGFRCPCGVDVVDRPLGLLRLLFNRVSGLARFGDLVSCTDPTGALSIIAENGDDDDATSAFDLELRKATRTAKTITAAEELSSTDDSEPAESKAWTTLPVQGVNDMQHTKGSDAVKGPGAGEDEDEDEEGWSHVSDDSLGNDEPDPTVQSGKFETRSMASRWFFN